MPSWIDFKNAHPHDMMWPVSMLYSCNIAEGLGWDTAVLDLHVEKLSRSAIVARVLSFRPDVLLVDSMTATVHLAREIADTVRQRRPETHIWAIGQHATAEPADLLFEDGCFDGAILGECDAVVPGLLTENWERAVDGCAVWEDGAIRIRGQRGEVHDLDALPPLDPTGLLLQRYHMKSFHVSSFRKPRWGFLLTSRGCPYECTFCSPTLRQSYGRQFRAQSAGRVVDDMRRLHANHGIDAFYLIDDIVSLERSRIVELCDILRRDNPGIRWAIQTRADALDRDVLRLMSKAGCVAVKIGVESGSDRVLQTLKKGETTAQIRDAVQEIHDAGLSLTACFMVGNPDETVDEIEQTKRFAKELRADMIQVAFNTPYPGSALHEQCRDRIRDLGNFSHYDTRQVNLSRVDDATLDRLQRRFYLEYFSHSPMLLKYLRHRGIYRIFETGELALVISTLKYLLFQHDRGALDEDTDVASASGRGCGLWLRPVSRHKVCLTAKERRKLVGYLLHGKARPGGRERFQDAAARYLGASRTFSFESGRTALAFVLRSLDLPPGGVVVLPSYGFFSLVGVIEALGLQPRFAPIDPETMALDPKALAAHLEGVSCVILIHPFGQAAPVEEILEICDRHGVTMVEDASQSTGASIDGRKAGTFGAAGVFSLVAGKNLQTFGGGLAVSSDPALIRRMEALWSGPGVAEPTAIERGRVREGLMQWALTTRLGFRTIAYPAFHVLSELAPEHFSAMFREPRVIFDTQRPMVRLSDFQGDLGCLELLELNRRNEARRLNALELMERLTSVPRIRFQRYRSDAVNTFNALAVRVADARPFQRELLRAGVDSREDYMEWFGSRPDFPEEVLYLPNHPGMEARDLEIVIRAVLRWSGAAADIKA